MSKMIRHCIDCGKQIEVKSQDAREGMGHHCLACWQRHSHKKHIQMSDAEKEALRYAARKRDFVATAGLHTSVEPLRLKSGKWRAYLRDFVTPWSNRGQEAESKEVIRDDYGNIITGATRDELVAKLKAEYPGWRWAT